MGNGLSIDIRDNPKAKRYLIIGIAVLGLIGFLFLLAPQFASLDSQGNAAILSLFNLFSGPAAFSIAFAFVILFVLGGIAMSLAGYKRENIGFFAMLAYFLAACLLICLPSFYDYALGIDGTYSYSWGLIVSAALLFACGLGEMIYLNKIDPLSIGEMAEMAVLVAMAVVLDMYVSFDIGATGGSVNFAIIPLYVIALRSGPAKGFIAGGLIFGFITCLTDGYGFYFFPFDYLLGWGSIAIIGCFRKWIFRDGAETYDLAGIACLSGAVLLSTLVRMIAGSVSSIVYYGYTFSAAFAYNAAYCLPTAVLGLVVMIVLFPALKRVNDLFKAKRGR